MSLTLPCYMQHSVTQARNICYVNSLASGRCGSNFKDIIFELILWIDTFSATSKIVVRWMPQNSTNDKSTLVQVMTWCRQATSHCLSQCWPRSLSPYGVTRTQWVKHLGLLKLRYYFKLHLMKRNGLIRWCMETLLCISKNIACSEPILTYC